MAKKLAKAQFGKAIKAGINAASNTYKKGVAKKTIENKNFLNSLNAEKRQAYLQKEADDKFKIKAMLGTGAAAAALAAANKKKKGGAVKAKKK